MSPTDAKNEQEVPTGPVVIGDPTVTAESSTGASGLRPDPSILETAIRNTGYIVVRRESRDRSLVYLDIASERIADEYARLSSEPVR